MGLTSIVHDPKTNTNMLDVKKNIDRIGDAIHGASNGVTKTMYCTIDTAYATQAPICAYPHGRSNPFLRLFVIG